ncbi:MAG: glycoside hydrolase family 9 protein, partial [Lachnospiraceae bacterium]|nr:glycoside hydrolase family 9 protein [Lachnospiraceae bacterium]
AAEENVHYLLGRNPLDRSYVTGQGAGAFKNPHNRPTASDGIDNPYPGLVSGGANAHPVDEPAKASIPVGTPPLYCHLDDIGSFSTNEIAIYWNSITAFVFAYFA